MDLILKSFALGALAECPSTSQEESFHISFTLHIYYIIFFIKNQIRTFVQNGVSTLHKAVVFPLAHLPMPDTLLGTTILDVQDGVLTLRCSNQLSYSPISGRRNAPQQFTYATLPGESVGEAGLEPATCGTTSKVILLLPSFGLEKVVWKLRNKPCISFLKPYIYIITYFF